MSIATRGFVDGMIATRGFFIPPFRSNVIMSVITLLPFSDQLSIGNDMLVSAVLHDAEGVELTEGTVMLRIYDEYSQLVAGITQPIQLVYESNGAWVGDIPESAQFENLKRYTLVLTATSGESDGEWRETLPARYRGFDA